ncbi:MAG: hypothetical protein MRZ79_08090 [Bacteroidia bacterium]|nr:hypothetical protein [Bacteroidia bacterium]
MRNIVLQISGFILLLLLQIFLFNHLVLFRLAVPYVFLLFLFVLPLKTSKLIIYPLTFFMGLTVDIFSDNAATGLHAFSALIAISLRGGLASLLSSSNFRGVDEIEIEEQSTIWLVIYLGILFFVHHFFYFLLEDFSFVRFLHKLGKTFFSTIYSTLIGFLIFFVFYKR